MQKQIQSFTYIIHLIILNKHTFHSNTAVQGAQQRALNSMESMQFVVAWLFTVFVG